jgi:cytidylate kinase
MFLRGRLAEVLEGRLAINLVHHHNKLMLFFDTPLDLRSVMMEAGTFEKV